jgi:hypothetical protein
MLQQGNTGHKKALAVKEGELPRFAARIVAGHNGSHQIGRRPLQLSDLPICDRNENSRKQVINKIERDISSQYYVVKVEERPTQAPIPINGVKVPL